MPPTLVSHKTQIDVPPETRDRLVSMLNASLADLIDLFNQTKHAHWNVKGPSFIALHELFDEVAERVEEHCDLLAERVVARPCPARSPLRGPRSGARSRSRRTSAILRPPTSLPRSRDRSTRICGFSRLIFKEGRNADAARA